MLRSTIMRPAPSAAAMRPSIARLRETGRAKLADSLDRMAHEITSDNSLDVEFKKQLFEQLEFVAQQAVVPPPGRKLGMIQAVMMALNASAPSTSKLRDAWRELFPLLEGAFRP